MLTEAGEPLRDEDLDFARDAGGLCALAVERLQAARLSDEQKARIDSLLHAGRSITSSLVLQEVLDAVAREVVDALGARLLRHLGVRRRTRTRWWSAPASASTPATASTAT